MKTPGINSTIFTVEFNNKYNKPFVIHTVKIKALEDPYRKWWKRILEFITFRIYRAPYQYRCKIIE